MSPKTTMMTTTKRTRIAAATFVAPFHRADDVELADGAAAMSAADRLVLCAEGYARLVDLEGIDDRSY